MFPCPRKNRSRASCNGHSRRILALLVQAQRGVTDYTTRPGLDWYGPFKWSSGTLDYWVNPQGIPSDVSTSSFVSYATASFQTWQDDPNSAITFTYRGNQNGLDP